MEQEVTGENKPERDENGRLLPGNTANPNGRPKGSVAFDKAFRLAIKKIADENKMTIDEAIAVLLRTLYKEAHGGDYQHLQLTLAYLFGKPVQPHEGEFGVNVKGATDLVKLLQDGFRETENTDQESG